MYVKIVYCIQHYHDVNACPADNNLEHFHIVLRCCDRCKKLMFSVMISADGVIRVPVINHDWSLF